MDQWLEFSELSDRAQELIDLGLHDEARTLLDRHAAQFSGEWELYFLYSRSFAEQDMPAEAIPYLHRALNLDPVNLDCLVELFYAYAMTGRMPHARSFLAKAEECHPGHELVVAALIWYYSETNDLGAAISCYERLRGRGTDSPETHRNAGIAYDRAGLYDRAAGCYAAALELQPDYDEARELLADLYLATGRPGKAVALYRQALAGSPNNIRYLSRLAFCLAENNEHEKARKTAEESIRLYPNSPVGHIDLAYQYLNAGALDKALDCACRALDIAPLDAESRRVKAVILSEKRDDAGAEAEFERALSLDPGNSEILRDYYHHFHRIGNYEKTEELVAQVIRRNDASCVEDYWFLADYWKEKGDFPLALRYLRKAYRIKPGEHDFLSMAADILIARGHTGLSLRFLRRYVELAGWNDLMEHMAAYPELRKGRMREAMRFLRFCGSTPADFHRHVFSRCLRKTTLLSSAAVAAAAAFPLAMLFGAAGAAGLTAVAAGVFSIDTVLRRKKIVSSSGR
jgi:tetratricopeptide (TPR) repeat protein